MGLHSTLYIPRCQIVTVHRIYSSFIRKIEGLSQSDLTGKPRNSKIKVSFSTQNWEYLFQKQSNFQMLIFFQWLLSWLLHKWRGYLLPTWARKITCQCFDWMLQSSSGESEELWTSVGIYSHALPSILSWNKLFSSWYFGCCVVLV